MIIPLEKFWALLRVKPDKDQRKIAEQEWSNGIPLCNETIQRAIELEFDFKWISINLLDPLQKEFNEKYDLAWRKSIEKRTLLNSQYEEKRMSLASEYEEKVELLDRKYECEEDPIFDYKYDEEIIPLDRKYNKIFELLQRKHDNQIKQSYHDHNNYNEQLLFEILIKQFT